MKNKSIIILILLGSFIWGINGCKKDDIENSENIYPLNEGTSNLNIHLAAHNTLKSIDSIEAVYINIQQICYHTSGDSTASGGWVELETIPGIYNLMDFVEDDTLIAFDSLVAFQTISQVRMTLGDSNTVMVDSVLYDLKTPSAQNSGLKVQVHAQIIPDSSYVIMLDFDPQQSVKQTGNGKYMLKPVINAIQNP